MVSLVLACLLSACGGGVEPMPATDAGDAATPAWSVQCKVGPRLARGGCNGTATSDYTIVWASGECLAHTADAPTHCATGTACEAIVAGHAEPGTCENAVAP